MPLLSFFDICRSVVSSSELCNCFSEDCELQDAVSSITSSHYWSCGGFHSGWLVFFFWFSFHSYVYLCTVFSKDYYYYFFYDWKFPCFVLCVNFFPPLTGCCPIDADLSWIICGIRSLMYLEAEIMMFRFDGFVRNVAQQPFLFLVIGWFSKL